MIKMKRIFSTSLRIRQCSSSTNSLTASGTNGINFIILNLLDMVKSSKSTKKRVGIVSRINAFALGLALTSGFGLYQLSVRAN